MDDLSGLWREHQNAAFPAGGLQEEVEGLRLVRLDAAAGAILTAALRTDGVPRPVDPLRRAELERLLGLAGKAAAATPDPDVRRYFERLCALGAALLKG